MLIRGTVRPVSGASDILAKKDCNINELFIADSDSRENSKTFGQISPNSQINRSKDTARKVAFGEEDAYPYGSK